MSVESRLKFLAFLGSTREGRNGLRVWKFVDSWFKEKRSGKIDVELVDPMELDLPILKKPVHYYGKEDKMPQKLSELKQKILEADGYILISCEYNHCIPPALSNVLDHFPASSFSYKPSGIITYSPGMYGGMRAAMQLRAMTGEIGCISVSNIFGIPKVDKAINEDGSTNDDHMDKGLTKLVTQLEWMAHAMKNHRNTKGIPQ